MKTLGIWALAGICACFAGAARASAVEEGILLERLSGSVGYTTPAQGRFVPVTGRLQLDPFDYALTKKRSMAQVTLPDSSVISIGASTRVRVGAFSTAHDVASMRIAIVDGALHFSVRHPAGGRSNYVFTTPTSQIGIRGTEGIIVVRPGETIVACVHGTPNDTLVTALDGSKIYVPVGQTLRIREIGHKRIRMLMSRGVSGPQFEQFGAIVARNHAMRANGGSR